MGESPLRNEDDEDTDAAKSPRSISMHANAAVIAAVPNCAALKLLIAFGNRQASSAGTLAIWGPDGGDKG